MTKQHIYAKVDDVEILKYYDRVGIKPTADDAFTFTVNSSNDNTVSISAKGNLVGELVIPYKTIIDGIEYTVTKIGSNAFADNTDLTSVIIPNTVKTIDNTAFNGCTNLTNIFRANTIGMATINNGEIFNDYINNKASYGSHAEGERTKAIGQHSHAEGSYTTASGEASHVEGGHNQAIGDYSHAEGNFTKAISKYSSVKGSRAIAGCKGYWYSSVELNNDGTTTIKLTTIHDEYRTEEWSESDKCGYQPDDIISIIADSKYYNCGTIKSVNNNVIVVKEDLFDKLTNYKFTFDGGFDGNIVFVLSKPDIGYVDLGIAATSEGGSVKDNEITAALGPFSHVEGRDNQAIGHYSHAEGRKNKASDVCAHVEGQNSIAQGMVSHAEGSHAEAIGKYSHAEGNSTIASGETSHAEGNDTEANGAGSHAEGWITHATDIGSHSEGRDTWARGEYSHAEGYNNQAIEKAAHAEGEGNIASGLRSHAEGIGNKAKGNSSHAEGSDNIAEGISSHAEGTYTTASGYSSHAEGFTTIAKGDSQHVQGRWNIEDTENKYAHIVGNGYHNDTTGTIKSNAHTLDWNGNAWFAGNVTSKSIILESSTEGSSKKFKLSINDNGEFSISEIEEI